MALDLEVLDSGLGKLYAATTSWRRPLFLETPRVSSYGCGSPDSGVSVGIDGSSTSQLSPEVKLPKPIGTGRPRHQAWSYDGTEVTTEKEETSYADLPETMWHFYPKHLAVSGVVWTQAWDSRTTVVEKSLKKTPPMGCGFCRKNGEVDFDSVGTRRLSGFYTTHNLKDDDGFVTCPILQSHKCTRCGQTGKLAHTRSHCPQKQQ